MSDVQNIGGEAMAVPAMLVKDAVNRYRLSSAWLASGGASAEFLIAQWEAKADELEQLAAEYRTTLTGLTAMTLEKARAYRACIKDLRRHAEAAKKRQPEANARISCDSNNQ